MPRVWRRALTPAALSALQQTVRLSSISGGGTVSAQITAGNAGSGVLRFKAEGTAESANWLKVASGSEFTATPSAPAVVQFLADASTLRAGVYTGAVILTDTAAGLQTQVPVVFTTTAARPAIGLSQTGLTFSGATGSLAPRAQVFMIANTGSGTLNRSAQTTLLTATNWMTVTPAAGSLAAGQAAQLTVTTSAQLPAGQYYGAIEMVSADAANSPQTITALLKLSATGSGVAPVTGGLILTSAPQTLTLWNPGTVAVNYSASAATQEGGAWLSVTPMSGSAVSGANSLRIAADLTGLTPGPHQGTVRIAADDGVISAVQVVAIAGTAAAPSLLQPSAISCTAGKALSLVAVFRQPLSKAQTGTAQTLQLQATDGCGAALARSVGGTVRVTFSNGDPALDLTDAGGGLWEGTWIPVNAGTVTLRASVLSGTPDTKLAGAATVAIPVEASPDSPPQPIGIVNAASAGQAVPGVVSPGSYVAIYGANLAGDSVASADSLPLPRLLNGTRLFLGGKPLPLLYAGAGQVNALIPQGLAPAASYPLVVLRGGKQSVPVPLTLARYQPGIYTVDTSGSGQGTVTNALTGRLGGPANPFAEGDYLTIFCTGLGAVQGPAGEAGPADGAAVPTDPLFRTVATASVTIGGVPARVLFSGSTATLAGLLQVNVQVPAGVFAGPSVPVVVSMTDPRSGEVALSNTVFISLQ